MLEKPRHVRLFKIVVLKFCNHHFTHIAASVTREWDEADWLDPLLTSKTLSIIVMLCVPSQVLRTWRIQRIFFIKKSQNMIFTLINYLKESCSKKNIRVQFKALQNIDIFFGIHIGVFLGLGGVTKYLFKKIKKKWHVTCDMWHATCDMWHVTCDIRQVKGGEHSLKISAS